MVAVGVGIEGRNPCIEPTKTDCTSVTSRDGIDRVETKSIAILLSKNSRSPLFIWPSDPAVLELVSIGIQFEDKGIGFPVSECSHFVSRNIRTGDTAPRLTDYPKTTIRLDQQIYSIIGRVGYE